MGQRCDLARQALDALVQPMPVAGQILNHPHHAGRQNVGARGEDARQLGPQEAQPLPHGNAALQQKGTDLVDDAGALADQTRTHAVQRLQVELFGSLRSDELHRRALHGFGDRLGVAEVVLLSLVVRADVFRRHQPGIVTKQLEPAAEVMRANAGFHADETRRHVGEPCFHLAARPLLPQHDCAPGIEAHDVERVFADINANDSDCGVEYLRHGVLLVFGAPFQLRWLVGQEHGRTIPLADMIVCGNRAGMLKAGWRNTV